MAPPDSQESRRRPAMLMAAVAGLVSVTAIACLVLVWPSAEPAAPAELLVMLFPLVSPAFLSLSFSPHLLSIRSLALPRASLSRFPCLKISRQPTSACYVDLFLLRRITHSASVCVCLSYDICSVMCMLITDNGSCLVQDGATS